MSEQRGNSQKIEIDLTEESNGQEEDEGETPRIIEPEDSDYFDSEEEQLTRMTFYAVDGAPLPRYVTREVSTTLSVEPAEVQRSVPQFEFIQNPYMMVPPRREEKTRGMRGNTRSNPQPRGQKKYFLTLNFQEDYRTPLHKCQRLFFSREWRLNGYLIGMEEAPTTGQLHFHVWVEFTKDKTCREIHNIKQDLWFNVQPCRGSDQSNWDYIGKNNRILDYMRIEGPPILWSETNLLTRYDNVKWFHWQQSRIAEACEQPGQDYREIIWTWSFAGGTGKNFVAGYLVGTRSGCLMGGSRKDCADTWRNYCESHGGHGPRILIWNLPRSNKGMSLTAAEQFIDGMIYFDKYKGGSDHFWPRKVFVFANRPPSNEEKAKLSKDRWRIYCVDPEVTIKEEECEELQDARLDFDIELELDVLSGERDPWAECEIL